MTIRHAGLRLAALSLIAVLPACGGGSTGSTPPPTPTPVPLAPFVVFQAAFSLQPFEFGAGDFTLGTPGAVRATADWTFPSNDVVLFVFSGTTCSLDDFQTFLAVGPFGACTLLASDIDTSTKPAVATFTATAAGGARVFVLNLGPAAESGTIQITLTR